MPIEPQALLPVLPSAFATDESLLNQPLNLAQYSQHRLKADPFPHLVIDDFFLPEVASELASAFPRHDDPAWYLDDNAIEQKLALNMWDRFPSAIYRAIWFLNRADFVAELERLTHCRLYPDIRLHGGGLHSLSRGGKLNIHLDYSLLSKLRLERRINLIIYLTPDWQTEWGGQLQLCAHDEKSSAPGEVRQLIEPRFNRAILSDTTHNSWHGLPEPLVCPEGIFRNSLAVYYLCDPRPTAPSRGRAKFAPHGDQQYDPAVIQLIEKRSGVRSLIQSPSVRNL
jgi:Rps23 Pro-64 3,4-dihydroxylase Tpa1-like proline 4-hydroxylase